MTSLDVTASRRPGRPRGEDLDGRVLEATVELLLELDDTSAVTMSAITARSGVSRAAVYRRWDNREALLAAALDSTRSPVVMPDTGFLLDDLIRVYTFDPSDTSPHFSKLLRKRLVVALQDPHMQRAYWEAHVSRRREPVAAAIARAQAQGVVRPDVDVDAVIDLIAGVHYYQLVVRGADPTTADTRRRVENGIRTVWRGMTVLD